MDSKETLMERENAMKQKGYVYLLTNPWIRDPKEPDCPLVKIGAATDFDNRKGNLNSAVPCDFVIEMAVNTEVWREKLWYNYCACGNSDAIADARLGSSSGVISYRNAPAF